MKKFNNILLVNDDGYDSKGIHLLKDKLEKYANRVVVLGPKKHMSAKSSSLILHTKKYIKKVDEDVYYCNGTPVECVLLGIKLLDGDIDLVVSGCNDGENVSYDCIYSGTIGATIEGEKNGYKSIAFSAPVGKLDIVEKHFDEVFEYILEKDLLTKDYSLNVNFPFIDFKGIKIREIKQINDKHYVKKVGSYYEIVRERQDVYKDINDEMSALHDGFVTISAVANVISAKEFYLDLVSKTK